MVEIQNRKDSDWNWKVILEERAMRDTTILKKFLNINNKFFSDNLHIGIKKILAALGILPENATDISIIRMKRPTQIQAIWHTSKPPSHKIIHTLHENGRWDLMSQNMA